MPQKRGQKQGLEKGWRGEGKQNIVAKAGREIKPAAVVHMMAPGGHRTLLLRSARELVVVWLFGRPRHAVMTCQVGAVSCKNTCLKKRGQKKGVEARANCPSHKTFYTKANTQPHDTPRYLMES